MKEICQFFLILACLSMVSCDSDSLEFDYSSFYKISILSDDREVDVSPVDSNRIRKIVLTYCEDFKSPWSSFPSPLYTLKLRISDKHGKEDEALFFIGTGWIGSRGKLVSISSEDSQILLSILENTIKQENLILP